MANVIETRYCATCANVPILVAFINMFGRMGSQIVLGTLGPRLLGIGRVCPLGSFNSVRAHKTRMMPQPDHQKRVTLSKVLCTKFTKQSISGLDIFITLEKS